MKFKISRKAQMEIIGLVVIVILITLGMLFLARFALNAKPQSTEVLRKGLAASAINALIETTAKQGDCVGINNLPVMPQMKDILIDCAKSHGSGPLEFRCGGEHSCQYFSDRAEELLGSILGERKKIYQFRADLLSTPLVNLVDVQSGGGCENSVKRDSSGAFPLPTYSVGLIENVLYICD